MSALAWRVAAVAVLTLALLAGWNALITYERGIGYQQRVAEDAVQLNKDLLQARAETERLFRLRDAAELRGAERERQLATQRDAAVAAASGLRGDLAEYRRRVPGSSVEACRAYADAGLRLLDECAQRYRTLAERAQGHFNDWKTLDEAWPQGHAEH